MKFERGLVFTDLHLRLKPKGTKGGHDEATWKAFLRYIETQRYDRVINLGDTMDFHFIHKKASARDVEGGRIAKEYDFANEQITNLTDAVYKNNAKAKITFIEGNHDHFIIKNLFAVNPMLIGSVKTVDQGLYLKERGIEWIPYWQDHGQYLQIGDAVFIHGLYTGDNHAKKTLGKFGSNSVYYGHKHDMVSYSPITYDTNRPVAQSMGMLADYFQEYMNGSPTNWQQGFGEFEFYSDGTHNYKLTRIYNHKIKSNGNIYG